MSHLEEITAAGVTPLARGKDTEAGFDSDADVVNFLSADSQTHTEADSESQALCVSQGSFVYII